MSGNFKKEDLRVSKTYKALTDALLLILKRKSFNQITVNDLCEEAAISRATFYYHFKDKYDLLKYYMNNILISQINDTINDNQSYEQLNVDVNDCINNNSKTILNLIDNADNEVLEIVFNFMLLLVGVSFDFNTDQNQKMQNQKIITFTSFYTGGLYYLLLWKIKNKLPLNMQLMNEHSYEILSNLLRWYKNE